MMQFYYVCRGKIDTSDNYLFNYLFRHHEALIGPSYISKPSTARGAIKETKLLLFSYTLWPIWCYGSAWLQWNGVENCFSIALFGSKQSNLQVIIIHTIYLIKLRKGVQRMWNLCDAFNVFNIFYLFIPKTCSNTFLLLADCLEVGPQLAAPALCVKLVLSCTSWLILIL